MANAAQALSDLPAAEDIPFAPSAERWRAMSKAERDAFLDTSLAALQREEARLAEGSPHITAKSGMFELLRDFYARIGRKIYIRSELPVHYPEERVFVPDLMAVLDVEDPWYDDDRMAWVVAEEGRGLDLVLEILHRGEPRKDLYENVLDYARMGIPEYFVYDRRKQRVHGWRLNFPGQTRYDPITAYGGKLSSRVLGLDLGIDRGRLRFSAGGAEVPETRALLAHVNAMVDDLEVKAEAETQRADAEAQRADTEAQRANAEAQRANAEAAARVEADRRAQAEGAARQELERRLAMLLARVGEG